MASNEQIELSDFVKNVHKSLREDSKTLGPEKAWTKHCQDAATLKEYSSAMEELATKHWKQNQEKADSKALSRINWTHTKCLEYFKEGGLEYQRKREHNIADKSSLKSKEIIISDSLEKYKLLDVGSCYNPFKEYDLYDVLAIDIAPANEDVKKCDFLNIKITNQEFENEKQIESLKLDSFHIVVFSLLLEYLPCSKQRLQCCKNAYNLLIPEGLLIIITPDAKHVGANAKYMKSWRFVLAKLGFCRIVYEKLPYIHCMVFRKSLNEKVAQRWATINVDKKLFDEIFIPQDFNSKPE